MWKPNISSHNFFQKLKPEYIVKSLIPDSKFIIKYLTPIEKLENQNHSWTRGKI